MVEKRLNPSVFSMKSYFTNLLLYDEQTRSAWTKKCREKVLKGYVRQFTIICNFSGFHDPCISKVDVVFNLL